MTGEEGEQVEMELKGLKLFVKRGSNAFSEGIFGHIKLLSNLETQEQRLREYQLVFRMLATLKWPVMTQFSVANLC